MRASSEYYRAETYQVFLRKLDAIESTLIAIKISFDPTLPIEQHGGLSENIKYAWYLYQIIALLKLTLKGPAYKQKSWFPQLSFYARVQTALPTLDAYFKEIQKIEANNEVNDEHFLLGVLFFEMLKTLNPRFTQGNNELWSLLYHGSPAWREGSRRMPVILDENLHRYFHTVETGEKIRLLDQIQNLDYHSYLQANVTPANSRDALKSLYISCATSQKAVVPVDISYLKDNLDAEYQKKRIRQLSFLQKQLMETNPIEPSELVSALQTNTVNIVDCFDCAVLSKDDRCSYLRPMDKLQFVFDAIVFRPEESDYSELSGLALSLGTYLLPGLTNFMTKESPGTAYIRSKLASFKPNYYNENFYTDLLSAKVKKKYYQNDANYILTQLIQRFNQELQLKKDLVALATDIDLYQQECALFTQNILDLLELLQSRITNIENYRYCPEVIVEFEALYRETFGAVTIERRSQHLGERLSSIKALEHPELKKESQLFDTLVKVNNRVQSLHEQNSTANMLHQFTELVKLIQKYEAEMQGQQARFTFPAHSPRLFSNFPYWSLLLFVLATIGIAVSIGILAGNPCLTYLVLPILADHTVAICSAALTLASMLAVKTGSDLMRYRLFRLSREGSLELERPEVLQQISP